MQHRGTSGVTGEPDAPRAPFHVVLYPNHSLGPWGASGVLLVAAAVSGALGSAFALAGAWPVTGFLGLDLVLLAAAFLVARRRSRRREEIRLDASGLHLLRIEPDGSARTVRLEPYWVRVQLEQPSPLTARLWLRSHGRRLRIGAFLTAEEVRGLARALERALLAHR